MTSILDQPQKLAALDPRSMNGLLETFPQQIRLAMESGERLQLPIPDRIAHVVVSGLGGSAIGADVVRSVVGDLLDVPFNVNRDYGLPRFCNRSSLVFFSSYSGNTEETLSAYGMARKAGVAMVCITSGGRLAAQAAADGVPVVRVPGGLPPRAALGHSSITLLLCLQALGLIPDMGASIRETIQLLTTLVDRYNCRVEESRNPAKMIARSLHGKIVAIYGSNGLLDAAAVRWRGQIEENGKHIAFHHLLPEMNHNELVGWGHPAEILRQVGVVFLRDPAEHAQLKRRFELTREMIREQAGVVHEVWSEGNSLLARIFSVISLGDFVSLYLAYLNAVDPTPVDAIELLKQKLSRP